MPFVVTANTVYNKQNKCENYTINYTKGVPKISLLTDGTRLNYERIQIKAHHNSQHSTVADCTMSYTRVEKCRKE
jgi:hypothetical protein